MMQLLAAMALDTGALHSAGGCFMGQHWLMRPCFDQQDMNPEMF